MRRVYLDHNATTPLHPAVKEALSDMLDTFGNPSSLHEYGRTAQHLVESSRETIAQFINAEPSELVFVGSGSEANNTVIPILSCPSSQCNCDHACGGDIITTTIEHPCVLETAKCMIERGVGVDFLKVDAQGKIDLDELRRTITDRTQVVSVMMANNEIGTVQDIAKVVEIAHEHNAFCHTDAVQAVGKIPIDVKALDIDFLTMSAHKIYGPKGIGALYVKKKVPFCPLIRGGHQERGRRAGTENVLGMIGFAKAVEMRAQEMDEEAVRLHKLKMSLCEGLQGQIPDTRVNGDLEGGLPGTLNISFEGVEGEAILLYLDLEGVAVSTGSACASGSLDPSHVLLALGLRPEQAHGSIRMSLGRETTAEDIDYTVDVVTRVIKRLRDMSPVYNKK